MFKCEVDETCHTCKWFGSNSDKDIEQYCWRGLHKVDNPENACIVWQPEEDK